ncbi:adenylyltransferase/cytidyltransferase family protein [Desulfitobacterium metallireducens]|uniref:Glycerol-3-phosphate cytidiltransferase n=1 Tax=Desulfitobacterium metallireducens DSM 15288 TaxID=871968 RepID=W0EDU0_9FIRM|nr:adenylyltransferase/cytidyltransferase family protein [Desulfitobacterium metallireducens]AHF07663.1 glycerol-3-phosphate cytidiltransferase [Desulfitobacterium metallireducens DSM 15288]
MNSQKKKYLIGYTAGVFDLFHVGHLNILRRAKEICEILIVGVNTDELVQEYKKKTPVIPTTERIAIVESIRYVDKVVPVTSRNKIMAYEKYRFDVLIVGDDWKGSNHYITIEEKLAKKGVTVIYVPYTQNTSSTLLRNVLSKI